MQPLYFLIQVKYLQIFLSSNYNKVAQHIKNKWFFRYISWDIEVKQEPDENGLKTHVPNLVVAFEIIINHSIINDVETFVDALKPFIFEGDDCIQD